MDNQPTYIAICISQVQYLGIVLLIDAISTFKPFALLLVCAYIVVFVDMSMPTATIDAMYNVVARVLQQRKESPIIGLDTTTTQQDEEEMSGSD